MNYQNHYDLLISRSKSRILEGYSERHHVIPKCMSGDNSNETLVKLTPEEHYLAHQLLVKIHPEIPGLVFAVNMMTWDNYGNRQNNKKFGWIKRKCSILSSNSQKGQTKENNESRLKQSKTMSTKMSELTKENSEIRKKQSKTLSEQTKFNSTRCIKISNSLKKLSNEREYELFNMQENCISGKEIQKYFKSLNIKISYSSGSAIYNRVKNARENQN